MSSTRRVFPETFKREAVHRVAVRYPSGEPRGTAGLEGLGGPGGELMPPPVPRQQRGVALGRKARLFCGSDRGDQPAAILYSLIVSAKPRWTILTCPPPVPRSL